MRLVDHQHKIRIVLNKADQVDKATLRRVRARDASTTDTTIVLSFCDALHNMMTHTLHTYR